MPLNTASNERVERSPPRGGRAVVRLPPRAQAARMGRSAVRQALAGTSRDVVERVELLVSELVTNSVVHAALSPTESVDLKVIVTPRRVRAEVADPGARFEPSPLPGRGAESKWGLFLLNELSNRWGMERLERGKAIWFEIDL